MRDTLSLIFQFACVDGEQIIRAFDIRRCSHRKVAVVWDLWESVFSPARFGVFL
jgi:hypothetical protein